MKTTAEKQREMMEQTIGVEVEMNNITRENAAKVAAKFFRTNNYRYTNDEDGYGTWSAFDSQGRKWKFSRDISISGPESKQCELVTPILRYEDIETLQKLIRALRKNGAKSDCNRGCGVHVHIGADGHNAKTIRNLVNIMASHEKLLQQSLELDDSRVYRYCKPTDKKFLEELNRKKPDNISDLADIWYETQGCDYARSHHYNRSRYHMLNLHATFTKGTIEFRMFQFNAPSADRRNGLHAGRLKAYIQLCLAMSQRAKDVRHAKFEEPIAMENLKYVMRFWLKTMCMLGDEFQTARDVFVDKLPGNSDCRSGRRAA